MENLTAETFKTKVFDYTTNAEWKFVGSKPAIIDFYADWCAPCKSVAPTLEELSTEFEGIDFYKVNVDEEQELATAFQIKSIPAILFIPVTEMPQMVLGAVPKDALKRAIKDVLGIE